MLEERKGKTACNEGRHTKERIVESLELPKDILLGASVITIVGTSELRIENYKGILSYTPDCILILGKHQKIRISGSGLMILSYTREEMKIGGVIRGIGYE